MAALFSSVALSVRSWSGNCGRSLSLPAKIAKQQAVVLQHQKQVCSSNSPSVLGALSAQSSISFRLPARSSFSAAASSSSSPPSIQQVHFPGPGCRIMTGASSVPPIPSMTSTMFFSPLPSGVQRRSFSILSRAANGSGAAFRAVGALTGRLETTTITPTATTIATTATSRRSVVTNGGVMKDRMQARARVLRDQKRRELFAKFELKRLHLKVIRRSMNIPAVYRYLAQHELDLLPKNSSASRIVNRCALSQRGRGVYKHFRLSRIKFRELANMGMLPGIRKSSW